VTTRQIAARVGISQTALYVYFKNKEDMLDRLVVDALRKLGAALDAVGAGVEDPVEYLRATLREYTRFGLENPDEYRLVFMQPAVRRESGGTEGPKASQARDALFSGLLRRIQLGVANGQFICPKGEREMALAVWSAMHGLVALRLADQHFDWPPVETQIDAHVEQILNGIAPACGAAKRQKAPASAP
jgi:AcrR family transcriptional regulator